MNDRQAVIGGASRDPVIRSKAEVGAELLLWAADPGAAPEHPNLVLWAGSATRPGVRSVAASLDADAHDIRRRYLAWAHDLGEISVAGRKLRERFLFADGSSLWAQSAFVEQSPWVQQSLETILKVLTFEAMIAREAPKQIVYAGADRDLHAVLGSVCRERGVRYRWFRTSAARQPMNIARLRRMAPHFVRGLGWLAHLAISRIGLRARPRAASTRSERNVLICGPFSNHNAAECVRDNGEFASHFWGALPRLLIEHGFQVQWLHYFFPDEATADPRTAARLIARLNETPGSNGTHILVDSYLTLAGVLRICARWLLICGESLFVGLALRLRFRRTPRQSYWPLIRRDWARALQGAACVENLYFVECYERALQSLPQHQDCMYLMENQGWERALARAWHRRGGGRLAAVAHSTIRYWDLRYHCDPRRYAAEYRDFLPGPDVVVLNGPAARNEYLSSVPERETLAECEALRYQHLVVGTGRALPRDEAHALRLLVLGDFQREATDKLVRLADGARRAAALPIEIMLKPHPICPIEAREYPDVPLTIANDLVARLVPQVHVVFASNTTSSAVEAYVGGARVLVYDPQAGVNYSPLRRFEDVCFVHTAADIASVLERLRGARSENRSREQRFFNIDAGLTRWRRYFDLDVGASSPAR